MSSFAIAVGLFCPTLLFAHSVHLAGGGKRAPNGDLIATVCLFGTVWFLIDTAMYLVGVWNG